MHAGEKALLSSNAEGMVIHLNGSGELVAVQRAARKLDGQGIKQVHLSGEGWDLEKCWAFWQGYRGPKGSRQVQWPELSESDRAELIAA